MLPMNGGPLTVPSASSRGTRPGDPARSRCLLRIPFGISAMREPGAAARRSEQASRMSRNRQEQRPGGGAGRTRR
jgi:hypothetical protein